MCLLIIHALAIYRIARGTPFGRPLRHRIQAMKIMRLYAACVGAVPARAARCDD